MDIYNYTKTLHELAVGIRGKFVLASFGENLQPRVRHFNISEHKEMAELALVWAKEAGCNVYIPPVVMRSDLSPSSKGGIDDIVAILGFVADFDEGRGVNWKGRIPEGLDASFVIETSPNNAQCFFLLDEPLLIRTNEERVYAKQLAFNFTASCDGADKCGSDLSHVWRVPDTLNYPTQKKIKDGRDPNPFLVRIVKEWYGEVIAIKSLEKLPNVIKHNQRGAPVDGELIDIKLVDLDGLLSKLVMSESIQKLWNEPAAGSGSQSERDFHFTCAICKDNPRLSDIELMALLNNFRKRGDDHKGKAEDVKYLSRTIGSAAQAVFSGEDEFSAVEVANITNPLNDSWGEPYNILGDTKITGQAKLEKQMLPDSIAGYAFDAAERLGVSPEMIALPCLVVAASVIHDGFKLQPKVYDTEWTESGRLWLAVVADPGGKKTPAINAALKPLKSLEAEWNKENEKKLKAYETKLNEKGPKSKNITNIPEPTKPALRRGIVNDATVESLGIILVDNPGGVLAVHDELMGLIGSMDAYKGHKTGKDRSAWLELHNGGSHSVDRVSKGRSVFVPNWSACVIGGIQPEKLLSIASTLTEDGLLQRFVPFFGRDTGYEIDRKPDEKAYNDYHDIIRRLSLLEPNDFNCRIALSREAQKHREEVYYITDHIKILPETTPALRAHLAKWNGLYARLLIVYHFVDCVSSEGEFGSVVSEETAERVKHLMLQTLLPNVARFYNDLIGDGGNDKHVRWLAGYILSSGAETMTIREVKRKYRSLRDADYRTIASIMENLEILNWTKPNDAPNGKPPTKWTVNPLVHSTFTAKAQAEKERRDDVKEKIAQAVKVLKELRENVPNVT